MLLSYLLRGISTNIWIHFKPLEYTFLPFPGSNVQQLSKNTISLLMLRFVLIVCIFFWPLYGNRTIICLCSVNFYMYFHPSEVYECSFFINSLPHPRFPTLSIWLNVGHHISVIITRNYIFSSMVTHKRFFI